jgi:pectinesterase
VHSQRQFYRDCDIYGTVDFIFGDAVAVLQNCNIYVRRPMSKQTNTVTAQGRTDPDENTGIVIHNSRVMAAPDLRPVQGSFKSYLGRPWKKYSRTVFLKSNIDGLIDPAGWLPWKGDFALSTLYYGEYMRLGAEQAPKGGLSGLDITQSQAHWRLESSLLRTFWPGILGFRLPECPLSLVYKRGNLSIVIEQ